MITEAQKRLLTAKFPELLGKDCILGKEVYAHFGLLFMKFALVEHSLINVITFHDVATGFRRGDIQTRVDWENAFDKYTESACNLTLGNLIRRVIGIEEFKGLGPEIKRVKNLRDYFAHRFYRNEAVYHVSDEGCWFLLHKIHEVAREVIDAEESLKNPFRRMCDRLGFPTPKETEMDSIAANLQKDAISELKLKNARVGWE